MYLTALQQGCYKIPLAQLAPGDVELSPSDFKNTFFLARFVTVLLTGTVFELRGFTGMGLRDAGSRTGHYIRM
jgi:hypothetical protein